MSEIDLEAMDIFVAEMTHNGGQCSQEFDDWSEQHRNNWAAIKTEIERLRARVKEPFDREAMIGLCLGFCGVPNAGQGDPYYDDAAKRVDAMIKERNKG